MGEFKQLTASDGHTLSAYQASPAGEPIGAVVLIQEIFGLNKDIRGLADDFAKEGYLVLAPATMDRIERGVELGYEGDDLKRAFEFYGKLSVDTAILDVAAAYKELEKAGKGIAIVGYCYGGLMSWLSATRGENVEMQPSCCVGYYAGGIGNVATEEPSCPVMLHFGEADDHIGSDQINAVRNAHPEVEIFLYEGAGHAFSNPGRKSFVPAAAKLAGERTLEFLKNNVA
ncbi:dienelactone hydrolase family protein [Granulicella sp. WH15]|uniref:dienelactone hydrolase family protein n=1 Tax=Granulicella sp. WH15 TaxID=2602070 RepID=UPI0013671B4C|nr:dienelactone hydrolase family protein [Granulicella sp. WH15]QHN03943.1 dienelactone hydrolase family protein [Granulicella sp. WH15]